MESEFILGTNSFVLFSFLAMAFPNILNGKWKIDGTNCFSAVGIKLTNKQCDMAEGGKKTDA